MLEESDESLSWRSIAHPRKRGRAVAVKACRRKECANSAWCGFWVYVPEIDWKKIVSMDFQLVNDTVKKGTEIRQLFVPDGLRIIQVTTRSQLKRELPVLLDSMEDDVLAIDLEWSRRRKGVDLIQLASSSICLLIRTHQKLRASFPKELFNLLRNEEIVFVGFSWDTADERMMRKTWSIGKKNIANFLDLKLIAESLGFRGYGLAALAKTVLQASMPKSKKISRSNWAAKTLTRPQCIYAALDAFAAGHMFRILRQWHKHPQPCLVCGYNVGEIIPIAPIACSSCQRTFQFPDGHKNHCQMQGHDWVNPVCNGCGRIVSKGQ